MNYEQKAKELRAEILKMLFACQFHTGKEQ